MSFNLDKFVSTVKCLAKDADLLSRSADVAETVRDDYSVDTIVSRWEMLFEEIESTH